MCQVFCKACNQYITDNDCPPDACPDKAIFIEGLCCYQDNNTNLLYGYSPMLSLQKEIWKYVIFNLVLFKKS